MILFSLLFTFLVRATCNALPKSSGIRIPINQQSPLNRIGSITNDPHQFVNTVKYCHNYPDLVCYDRHQNGFTTGDEYALTFQAETDASGLGSVYLQFPVPVDPEDLDSAGKSQVNGLFHCYNRPFVLGMQVLVASFNPQVRFGPHAHLLHSEDVPIVRWSLGLFVDFQGPPRTNVVLMVFRHVIWLRVPPYTPCVTPPFSGGAHEDL